MIDIFPISTNNLERTVASVQEAEICGCLDLIQNAARLPTIPTEEDESNE